MKKNVIYLVALLLVVCGEAKAQRHTDQLGRGLVAAPTGAAGNSTSNLVMWRRLADEYYDVKYNVYKNGTKVASNLTTTCYNDAKSAPSGTQYQVAAVVNGVEQEKCAVVTPWDGNAYKPDDSHRYAFGYKDIALAIVYDRNGNDVTANYIANDAEVADLDGDGELEIIIKRLNTVDASTALTGYLYPQTSTQFVVIDAYDVNWAAGTATLLWRIDCGPNMVSLNSTEIDIIAYDWDEDGKAEVVLRGADNMKVLGADGTTLKYNIGDMSVNTRNTFSTDDSQYAWTHTGAEYLLYLNGATGDLYQQMDYPLKRLESGESSLKTAWGDDYGHRSSKYFFGAPFLDGRHASLFLARGIYTRHKMMAMDLNKGSHQWSERWSWSCNEKGSWYGQGYHNFIVADVDEDGRDEIVYGSMVIDDNGQGLSTTGYGHGDAQHVGDFNPYRKGLEYFGCLEESPVWGSNYRDATTSEVLYKYTSPAGTGKSGDDGRCLMANLTNQHIGSQGRSVGSEIISSVTNQKVMEKPGESENNKALFWSHLNFRIYWDGDLCSEILDSPGTEGYPAIWDVDNGRLFTGTANGGNMNNDSKNNPCFQGDIIGDWREEIIVRKGTDIRVYITALATDYSMPSLWFDHQYRQAMVWQMMAYNQPPHVSYFMGETEGFTVAPPALTNTGRTEVANGGTINTTTDHLLMAETNDMTVSVTDGAAPYILTVNTPSWVQGSGDNNGITTTTFTHTLTGGAFTGSMRLVKQGDGTLVLPDVTETYTGNTDVWAGALAFSGTLSSSPVWMNRHTNLFGAPTISKSLTMEYGSTFYPSATGVADASTASYATANIGTLNMHEGSRMVFQIDPANSQSDQVNIGTLNLRVRSGEVWESEGPEYLKPVIEIVAKSSLGYGQKFTLGTLDALTVNGAPVSESNETPVSAVVLEGAGTGKLYFYNGELVLFFEGASWDNTPTVTLLAEDYESYAVGDITSTMQTNGWTFQSKADPTNNEVTIKEGTSPNATQYFDFYYPDGGASRNQRWDFGVTSSLNADNWTLTFSAALNPGTQNSANKFYVTGTSTGNLETANDDVTNPLFALKGTAAGSTTYKPTFGATEYDEELTLESGTWYRFVVRATEIDAVNNTATLYIKISSYDGNTTILEKEVSNLNTSAIGSLRGLCWNSPRGASRLNLDDVVLTKKMTSVLTTITAAGWSTLYTPYALDFSAVEGLTAYTATCSENMVTLTPVDNVPANTGVVLKGAAKTYSIPLIASSSTAQGHLKGSATEATAWNAYSGYNLYVLTSVDNGANVQFNPVISGSIAAGKAFLKVNGGASSAHALNVVFADDLTGISEAKAEGLAAKVGKFFEDGKLFIYKRGMKFNANGQLVK